MNLAERLLAHATLYVAGTAYRFTELELYLTSPAHPDPFTHRDPFQQQVRWYFHRSGQSYRGGTFKGVDIAFGSADTFAGMLVRGIARGDTLFDGPCVVVDHLLAATGCATVAELAARAVDLASPPLAIAFDAARTAPIHTTARIGLTLKVDAAVRRPYLARRYRFLSEPAKIKKGKPHLAVALHLDGHAPADIAALTGSRRAVVEAYIAAFEAGRAGDLSRHEVCGLLGAAQGAAELGGEHATHHGDVDLSELLGHRRHDG